jgi:hypothetical protein
LDTRQSELTVPYFHVVFTLPDSINVLAMQDPRLVYDLLFESAWATLKSFGQRNPNWDDAVFYTWGQNLSLNRTYTASYQAAGLIK